MGSLCKILGVRGGSEGAVYNRYPLPMHIVHLVPTICNLQAPTMLPVRKNIDVPPHHYSKIVVNVMLYASTFLGMAIKHLRDVSARPFLVRSAQEGLNKQLELGAPHQGCHPFCKPMIYLSGALCMGHVFSLAVPKIVSVSTPSSRGR